MCWEPLITATRQVLLQSEGSQDILHLHAASRHVGQFCQRGLPFHYFWGAARTCPTHPSLLACSMQQAFMQACSLMLLVSWSPHMCAAGM